MFTERLATVELDPQLARAVDGEVLLLGQCVQHGVHRGIPLGLVGLLVAALQRVGLAVTHASRVGGGEERVWSVVGGQCVCVCLCAGGSISINFRAAQCRAHTGTRW